MTSPAPYLGQGCGSPYTRPELLRREIWALVQRTVFRLSPRSWHGYRARLLRAFGADIPEPSQVVVFPTVSVIFPWKLRLAPRAMLAPGVIVYNLAPVEIQYGANLSQNVQLCAGSHDYRRWSMPLVARPIVVGPNAWLGAEVFVGPGVTIGELCVVGARSVVMRDLPARQVCVGNPCRPVKPREDPVA